MSAVRSPYTRSAWYNRGSRVEPGKDHVFSQIDEEKHTKRRTQMTAGYSGKENLSLDQDVDARVVELLDLIRSKYVSIVGEAAKKMDLGQKIQFFTLDVISTVGFGQPFGDLKADADVNNYNKSAEEGLSIVAVTLALGLIPILQWPPIARLLGASEKDKSGFGKMQASARAMIDARLSKSTEERSNMLASFSRHGLTKDEIFTESMLQIIAGSDTTATALRSIMLYLLTHPPAYFKLQAEIDNAVKSGAVCTAPNVASDACLKNLPYLQAVAREGLRIHPAITDLAPKKVPVGGDTVTVRGKKHFLPGGTNVGYDVLGLCHSEELFGDDASVFRPDRWLIAEKMRTM